MRLRAKLGSSTGGLVLVMLGSAYCAHVRIAEANRISQQMTEEQLPAISATRDARSHITQSILAQESYILFGLNAEASAEFRATREAQTAEAERAVSRLSGLRSALQPEDAVRMERLSDDVAKLKTAEEQVEALNESHAPDKVAQAYIKLKDEILPLERLLYRTTTEMADSERQQAETAGNHLRQANRLTLTTLWLACMLGVAIGALLYLLLGRQITEAVVMVAKRANSIAEGDLTGAELKLGSDEIGMMAEAMNRMQASLRGIIGTVADTAGALTGSAKSMGTASDKIHRRIDQQSQQTQQAATAMQEMSASIAEVSRHTQSAAETARSAAQTAREGGMIVKEMLGAMDGIAVAVTETSTTVGLLGEDSKRISQIVTVIDEIARKTNLLALNAAIEAARAGDQGRGFAVVAGEVRRLAESTAQATGEIAGMIQGIQDRTRTAIGSMQAGTATVQEGVVTTTQAGEALERIIGMAERVDRMITQIAIAASQQATAADQSSASLDSIHTLSHENLSEMTTTAAGIESLRGTAVMLEKQVDRFQVAMSC